MTFSDLGLIPEIASVVEEKGYTEPTLIQQAAIPVILKGKDVIGSAQTGTGKTAAFALPVLQLLKEHGEVPRCLVVGPTRELIMQVDEQFRIYGRKLNLNYALLYGGVKYATQNRELGEIPDVVVATPGRLLDHVQQRSLDLRNIQYLILDEVDRMFDMGFIEDVRRIISRCSSKTRQTLLFSATVGDKVRSLAGWALKDPEEIIIGLRHKPADTIEHAVYPVGALQKFDLLLHLLETIQSDNIIIFCRMRRGADRIARWLAEHGKDVAALHSDLNQAERTKALDKFKNGNFGILVATDIASRGLDIANVSHVINYDVPLHAEDYVHRIGRTGRARKEGSACTLEAPDEASLVQAIEKLIGRPIERRKLEGFEYRYEPKVETTPVKTVRRKRNQGYLGRR
ncbi:MAG: DEAD/DEAH box helicase [Puniceicoccaceae bacterium]